MCIYTFLVSSFFLEDMHNTRTNTRHALTHSHTRTPNSHILQVAATVVLVAFKPEGKALWEHSLLYFAFSMVFMFAAMEVWLINRALKRHNALVVIPIQVSFHTLVSALGGIVYFNEWSAMSTEGHIMFPIAVAILLCGTSIAARSGVVKIRNQDAAMIQRLQAAQGTVRGIGNGNGHGTASSDWDVDVERAHGDDRDDSHLVLVDSDEDDAI